MWNKINVRSKRKQLYRKSVFSKNYNSVCKKKIKIVSYISEDRTYKRILISYDLNCRNMGLIEKIPLELELWLFKVGRKRITK